VNFLDGGNGGAVQCRLFHMARVKGGRERGQVGNTSGLTEPEDREGLLACEWEVKGKAGTWYSRWIQSGR